MTPEELAQEQIKLLREQNKLLLNMAVHTRLLHVVAWVSLVGSVLFAAVVASNGSDGPGSVIIVLLFGGGLLAAIAFGVKNIQGQGSAASTSAATE